MDERLQNGTAIIGVAFLTAYLESSSEIREVIRDMVGILNSDTAADDERAAAQSTLAEALFPTAPVRW